METQSNACTHGLGDPRWCTVCQRGWHGGAQAEREAIAREGARIGRLARGRAEAGAVRTLARSGRRPDERAFERGSSSWRDRLAYRPEVKRAGVGGPGYVGAARPGISTAL